MDRSKHGQEVECSDHRLCKEVNLCMDLCGVLRMTLYCTAVIRILHLCPLNQERNLFHGKHTMELYLVVIGIQATTLLYHVEKTADTECGISMVANFIHLPPMTM